MKKLMGMSLMAGAMVYGQAPPPPPPLPPGVAGTRITIADAGPMGAMAFSGGDISIEMALVKGAPFSGEFVTESLQQLADGNRITSKRTEVYARDGEGRTRREMGPVTFIHDPVAKVDLILENQRKTVRKVALPDLPPGGPGKDVLFFNSAAPPPPAGGAPRIMTFGRTAVPDGQAPKFETKTEPLGKRMIEGTEAEGTRTTVTVPAGAMGNQLPLVTVSERWVSTELKTVVLSTRKDPQTGETTYRLTNLRKGEPSRILFEAPADYTMASEESGPVMIHRMRIEKKND